MFCVSLCFLGCLLRSGVGCVQAWYEFTFVCCLGLDVLFVAVWCLFVIWFLLVSVVIGLFGFGCLGVRCIWHLWVLFGVCLGFASGCVCLFFVFVLFVCVVLLFCVSFVNLLNVVCFVGFGSVFRLCCCLIFVVCFLLWFVFEVILFWTRFVCLIGVCCWVYFGVAWIVCVWTVGLDFVLVGFCLFTFVVVFFDLRCLFVYCCIGGDCGLLLLVECCFCICLIVDCLFGKLFDCFYCNSVAWFVVLICMILLIVVYLCVWLFIDSYFGCLFSACCLLVIGGLCLWRLFSCWWFWLLLRLLLLLYYGYLFVYLYLLVLLLAWLFAGCILVVWFALLVLMLVVLAWWLVGSCFECVCLKVVRFVNLLWWLCCLGVVGYDVELLFMFVFCLLVIWIVNLCLFAVLVLISVW